MSEQEKYVLRLENALFSIFEDKPVFATLDDLGLPEDEIAVIKETYYEALNKRHAEQKA